MKTTYHLLYWTSHLPEWMYGRQWLMGLFFAMLIGGALFPKRKTGVLFA